MLRYADSRKPGKFLAEVMAHEDGVCGLSQSHLVEGLVATVGSKVGVTGLDALLSVSDCFIILGAEGLEAVRLRHHHASLHPPGQHGQCQRGELLPRLVLHARSGCPNGGDGETRQLGQVPRGPAMLREGGDDEEEGRGGVTGMGRIRGYCCCCWGVVDLGEGNKESVGYYCVVFGFGLPQHVSVA